MTIHALRKTSRFQADQTGRRQLGRNVITSWLSQLVFIVFGFVMPRAIDGALGQDLLGIWDFGWAIVSYLSVAMVGIGSSVNRYVARYRASGEHDSLSATISSVAAIQFAIGCGVFAIVFALYYLTPLILNHKLGAHTETAATVVLFLGASLSVQMIFDTFRGVLTGCHRWTAYNFLNAGGYAVAGTGMLIVLMQGGGLEAMATIYLIVTILTELLRLRLAQSVCPEIHLSWKNVNRKDVVKVVRFGLKTVLIYMPQLIIRQTVTLFVVANLGAAMLAILARPLGLVGHISTLMSKFAFVLTPIAGSLQGGGKDAELKEFAVFAMRVGWFLAVLPGTYMLVLGDRLIELWMGPGYVNQDVIMILAAGTIFPIAQRTLVTIMSGLNRHGRIAKINLIVSAVIMVAGLVLISVFGWTLAAAAWLIVIPGNLGVGLVALIVSCKVLRIEAEEYIKTVLRDPLILLVTSVASLYLVRNFGPQSPIASLAAGALVHAGIAGIVLRKDIRTLIGKRKTEIGKRKTESQGVG